DEGARALLEGYYWRGNIRQLKNIAEQISAVEQSRVITADILSGYLPQLGGATSSIVASDKERNTEGYAAGEREILYKVLFDMRSEIGELRRMVSQLLVKEGVNPTVGVVPVVTPQLQAALPSHEDNMSSSIVGVLSTASDDTGYYAESEEVRDEPREMTKSDMQREQITRALRRHNGRRKDAAAELFMSERTLYRRIKELGIEEL
ncbi:MAG: helix-turn-helix domain-containing protein, partial [Rikenellaceae bacterium]